MLIRFFISVFFAALFLACSNDNSSKNSVSKNYPLKNKIETIVQNLTDNNVGLELVSKTKNETDSVLMDKNVDWKKELNLFFLLDIENQKYRDSFVCDTVVLGNNAFLLRYKSNEEKCKIKQVELLFKKTELETIYAIIKESNYIYDSETTLFFERNNYYTIESADNFGWLSFLNTELSIKGRIL